MKKPVCRSALAGLALACLSSAATHAGPMLSTTDVLTSRLFVNDFLGDHKDRWRTSSYSASVMKMTPGGGVNEIRLRGENIAGSDIDLREGALPDRPAAGILGLGYYRSDRMGKYDYRIGAEMTAIGPQTGVVDFQKSAHDLLGMDPPSRRFIETQLGDDVRLSANLELGRDILLTDKLSVRPWIGASTGVETLARAGADVVWGAGAARFGVRDEVTGWRKPADGPDGASLLFGIDHARVYHTELLGPGAAEATRTRIRAGGLIEDGRVGVFYGLAYLSEEFRGQDGGQVVGALSVSLGF